MTDQEQVGELQVVEILREGVNLGLSTIISAWAGGGVGSSVSAEGLVLGSGFRDVFFPEYVSFDIRLTWSAVEDGARLGFSKVAWPSPLPGALKAGWVL
ncbi:hypothetical protein [Haloglycomyces albus]|uniref:hypothetical protein n=1 Tax=Haloglycomyces albus TaxID=526067 RepID=UPI00146FAD64|nr:hypothetical protein [Haloglycomyces albus]